MIREVFIFSSLITNIGKSQEIILRREIFVIL